MVPLPSHSPDLLGIASFRGALVPIFDLRLLLGYSAGVLPRWLVLTKHDLSIGLAFDRLDGYLSLTSEAVVPAAETQRKHLAEAVSAAGLVRPVIDVVSIVKTVQVQSSSTREAG
jgi:purine-binding chemotaxis protein CheW